MSMFKTHPLTGEPIVPVGFRKPRLGETAMQPIWPIMGGSEDAGDTGDQGGDAGDDAAAQAEAEAAAAAKAAGKPLAEMTEAEQVAYWKAQSKKHEQRAKGGPSAEEWQAAQERIAEFEKASLSESEKAIAEAYERGKAEAAAAGSAAAAQALIDARKAYLDDDKDADTIESLDLIDISKFISDGIVDSVRLTKFLDRLAPSGGGSSDKPWPNGGQGDRNTGTGSAKDAGKAEAARRFGNDK